jgi:hypothetical protein
MPRGAHWRHPKKYTTYLERGDIEFEVQVEMHGWFSKGSLDSPPEEPEMEVLGISCAGKEVDIDLTDREHEEIYMRMVEQADDDYVAQEEDAYDARRDR